MCLEKDTDFNRMHSVVMQEPGKYPSGSARLRGCHLLARQHTVCTSQSTTDFPLMHLVYCVLQLCSVGACVRYWPQNSLTRTQIYYCKMSSTLETLCTTESYFILFSVNPYPANVENMVSS
jgi:hypothetical protein